MSAPNPDALTRKPGTTLVFYRYRDGSNYKQSSVVVFDGQITDEERTAVFAKLGEDGRFLPAQVGLEVLYSRFDSAYEDDHPWHELVALEAGEGTGALTAGPIGAFVEAVLAAAWDIEAATEALAAWKARVPRGA